MSWGSFGFFPFWGLVMMVFWILVLVAVVALVVRLLQGRPGEGPPPLKRDSALEILRERYARGEITKEQFEEMRRDLGGS